MAQINTLNLAHRGFSGRYPENTRAAFEAAVTVEGCDGFESDVNMTKDGKVVVIHDPVLDRTSNGCGMVRDHTYDELLPLDFGAWMSAEFAGQRIMLWSELLDFTRETNKILNIELKNYEVFYDGLEEAVIQEIQRQKMQDQVFLSSFNHISMARCKQIDPAIRTGLLYGYPLDHTEQYVERTRADAVHPRYTVLQYQPELTAALRTMGRDVNTWTVNEDDDMRQMLAQGVSSIITNYPDRLAQVMGSL